MFRALYSLVASIFFLFFFVIGIPFVAAIVFYLGAKSSGAKSATLQSFGSATLELIKNVHLLIFAPSQIPESIEPIIAAYGNALVLGISLGAVLFSSWHLRERTRNLNILVPYDKFSPRSRYFFKIFSWFHYIPRLGLMYRQRVDAIYRTYYVRIMQYYYERADNLLIVSGDYSWLFDNSRSEDIRSHIRQLLPDRVTLLSHKKPTDVAKSWDEYPRSRSEKEIFGAITFDVPANIKATLITQNSSLRYIYLYKKTERHTELASVCVFHGDGEAGQLLRFTHEALSAMGSNAQQRKANTDEKQGILQSWPT